MPINFHPVVVGAVVFKLDQTPIKDSLEQHWNYTQEETNFKVMRFLEDNLDLTQRELAQPLRLIVGSVNYFLKALVDKGWVKMKIFAYSKNKFGYIYVLTPHGLTI